MEKKPSFDTLIHGDKPVLVDFYADWCGPCKAMNPIIQELAQSVGEQAKIIKINVDKNPKVAAKYQIQGIPTFVVFQNGQVKWRHSGMVGLQQLREVLR